MRGHLINCRLCGAEHMSAPRGASSPSGGGEACPYAGLAYAGLRAGHDQLYFGRWRGMEASRLEVDRARNGLERLLRAIAGVLDAEDVPAAKRDLNKAFDVVYTLGRDVTRPQDLILLDHALSYAHRVIGDLLHEKGLPPHAPADFAGWHEAGDVPFREDW